MVHTPTTILFSSILSQACVHVQDYLMISLQELKQFLIQWQGNE